MIELTTEQLWTGVIVCLFAGGVLTTLGPWLLGWSEERRQAKARREFTDDPYDPAMILRPETHDYVWPPHYRERLHREFLNQIRTTQPDKEGTTDDK